MAFKGGIRNRDHSSGVGPHSFMSVVFPLRLMIHAFLFFAATTLGWERHWAFLVRVKRPWRHVAREVGSGVRNIEEKRRWIGRLSEGGIERHNEV